MFLRVVIMVPHLEQQVFRLVRNSSSQPEVFVPLGVQTGDSISLDLAA